MKRLSRQFRRRVARDLEMWTNQPFTTPLVLGDIGSVSAGRFDTSTATTLKDLGIDIGDPLVGPEFPIRWQSNEDGSFSMTVKAQGDPPIGGLGQAEIGVSIAFGRKGNYVFEASDARISRIRETSTLHRAIAAARAERRIGMQDRIVTSCLSARRAKLYIAETNEAELTLSASAEFSSLVQAGVDFKLKRKRGSVLEIEVESAEPVVFFMQLVRVRRWGALDPVRSIMATSKIAGPLSRADFERSRVESADDVLQLAIASALEEDDLVEA